jgi:hypothetical protein
MVVRGLGMEEVGRNDYVETHENSKILFHVKTKSYSLYGLKR